MNVNLGQLVNSSHYIVTPRTLTLCLAYVHHYTPSFLPGRYLAPADLRALATWIGYPQLKLRSLRANPVLAGHMALLHAAGLLHIGGRSLYLGLEVMEWLHATPADQIGRLLVALDDQALWPATVARLGLQLTLTIDYAAYIKQTLARQQQVEAVTACENGLEVATWQPPPEEEGWLLSLPAALPTWLLFDLLQLGQWQPGRPLHITPLAVAAAPARKYGYEHIRWLLETATQAPLPAARQMQLRAWLARADAYQVNGPLLSTAQPDQLAALLADRRLRPYILRQLAPRHALIDPALLPRLRRWLAKRGYPLNQPPTLANEETAAADLDPSYQWLGLRLLAGLQKYLPLPFTAPTEQLFRLSQSLAPDTAERLERLAQKIMQDLDDVVGGRDAFFPARRSPSQQMVMQIEQAISREDTITLLYQAIGQEEPRRHHVEPLRLERRHSLIYLHAYSYRAEANLTFRLDRVVDVEA